MVTKSAETRRRMSEAALARWAATDRIRPVCSADSCGSPTEARGLCRTHYARLRRRGSASDEALLKPRGSVEARFWAKVNRDGPIPLHRPELGRCWVWTASTNTSGYGHLGVPGGELVATHRLSWELHNAPIPEGLWVLHHCDNPPCCNPAHLFLGTVTDNVRDMLAKGRRLAKRSVEVS